MAAIKIHANSSLWGAIKKFSAWPSSVQKKIKILFDSYSSRLRTRHARYDFWAINVHFSVWTQCLSDGCWKC